MIFETYGSNFRVKIGGDGPNSLWFGRNQFLGFWITLPRRFGRRRLRFLAGPRKTLRTRSGK